jgi:hypothetical protein
MSYISDFFHHNGYILFAIVMEPLGYLTEFVRSLYYTKARQLSVIEYNTKMLREGMDVETALDMKRVLNVYSGGKGFLIFLHGEELASKLCGNFSSRGYNHFIFDAGLLRAKRLLDNANSGADMIELAIQFGFTTEEELLKRLSKQKLEEIKAMDLDQFSDYFKRG